jgi:hypothetical protein
LSSLLEYTIQIHQERGRKYSNKNIIIIPTVFTPDLAPIVLQHMGQVARLK